MLYVVFVMEKNQYISQDIHTMVKRGAKSQLPFLEKFSPYFFLETFSSRLYSLSLLLLISLYSFHQIFNMCGDYLNYSIEIL